MTRNVAKLVQPPTVHREEVNPWTAEEARQFLESVVLPANAAFAAFLEGRVRAGEARELDVFVAARSLVGMLMIFLWTQHVLGGDALRRIDDRAIVETTSALFLRGVLASETPARPTPRA